MVVDAHQHFWNLARAAYAWMDPTDPRLHRTIEPPELAPLLAAHGIDRTVLVQAEDSLRETAYLLELASQYDWIGAVVGWVDLAHPEAAYRQLEEWTRHPKFRGVRHLLQYEADPRWILQPAVLEGLTVLARFGVTFDLSVFFPHHLQYVPEVAARVPHLLMVIDHLAKPPIREHGWEPWASELKAAASCPNVYAKVSGLNTAGDWHNWSPLDWQPYVDWALEVFGPDRLMFGSDWPVLNLAGSYAAVVHATKTVLAGLGDAVRNAILGGTAARFYRLDGAAGLQQDTAQTPLDSEARPRHDLPTA